jgi:hypothetical protein
VRGEQFQRIHNAGSAGVSESRSLHVDVASPGRSGNFARLDGGNF